MLGVGCETKACGFTEMLFPSKKLDYELNKYE
jgi:hypothetical protein